MLVILELIRRLTSEENNRIFSETGYAMDEELDRSHNDEPHNYIQFVGRSDDDCHEEGVDFGDETEEAHSIYFALNGMELPATDIYIDDGSASGLRPARHRHNCGR